MLEFSLALPLLLLLFFAVIQFTQLWLARVMVHYAAYNAARAMLVSHDSEYQASAQRAAEQTLFA